MIVPVSAIIPTRNRAAILSRFLDSLARQEVLPAELVVCDSSDDDQTDRLVEEQRMRFDKRLRWLYLRANRPGLALQRNQAVAAASQPFVWFLDDDIILEPGCLKNLFESIQNNPLVGGVTATLINEPYHPPGRWTRALMRWFEDGRVRSTYASACVGPGWTFLHDASTEGPALMPAEWLGGGCTIYRKAALPVPAVPEHFEGGAIGEDLAASLTVGQRWPMFHVRAARAIHDSKGGDHKRSARSRADQGLRNRYYIMTRVMGKDSVRDHFDFVLMHAFSLVSLLRSPSQWSYVIPNLTGVLQGAWKLLVHSSHA